MFGKSTGYDRMFRWTMTLSACLLMCSCAVFSRIFHPQPEEEAVAAFDAESAVYYDSLKLAAEASWRDSCVEVIEEELCAEILANTLCFYEELADSIVGFAMRYLGAPYKMGAVGPDRFDCSGFTSFVFRHFGVTLGRTTKSQLTDGDPILDPKDLRRGDLVFFGGRRQQRQLGHVAIVIDNNGSYFTFIHATIKLGVTVSKSTETYYKKRYLTACRILPES